MGRLKKIIEKISSESSGVQAKLLIARVGLKAGINVSTISDSSPDDPTIEAKLLRSAMEILGKKIEI